MSYALGVFTLSSVDAVLSWGCVEDVGVLEGQTAIASATALDLPLDVSGVYATEAEVLLADAPAHIEAVVVAASISVVDAAGGDAAYLLSPIRDALLAAADPCAAAFDAALPGVISDVDADLSMMGLGPKVALAALAATLGPNSERVDLSASLTVLGGDPSATTLSYELNGLALGPDDGSTPHAVDLAALGLDMSYPIDADFSADGSLLVLNELLVSVRTSQLVSALVAVEVDTRQVASPAELVADDVGCAALLANSSVTVFGCEAPTMQAACDLAVDALMVETLAEVASADDAEHDELRIAGSFPVVDLDEDHRADEIRGDLSGEWTSDAGSSPLTATGTFSALRVGPAPPAP